MTTSVIKANRMNDVQWPRVVNKVITRKWSELKNSLVMKDFVDYLIQKRVVTLDYWMGLKSKPIPESERTEDFLALVMKFDQQKYNYFLEALLTINRHDLVQELVKAQSVSNKSRKPRELNQTPNTSRNSNDNKTPIRDTSSKSPGVRVSSKSEVLKGQTDVDQFPTHSRNQIDGKIGDVENRLADTSMSGGGDNSELDAGSQKAKTIEKLHLGIGTKEGKSTNKDERKPIQRPSSGKAKKYVEFKHADEKDQDESKMADEDVTIEQDEKKPVQRPSSGKAKKYIEFKYANEKDKDKSKTADKDVTIKQEDIKTKEKLLQEREQMLKSRETELNEKEIALKDQEKSLQEKETELLTRENSIFLTTKASDIGTLSLSSQVLQLQSLDNSSPSTTMSDTQSSELLADVREQLKAMKRVREEIESEHTTHCSTPKEEYAKLVDFQMVQQDIDDLKEEIATDRETRETVQQKVEDLKEEVTTLQKTIKRLETEKEIRDAEIDREVNKLKTEMKNSKLNHNVDINKIKMEMKTKQDEVEKLKSDIQKFKKECNEHEKRIKVLENDKQRFEEELLRYEKEVSDLRTTLDAKENELVDMRNVLEDTENEKDDLIDELANLKAEVSRLKSDKKRLEQEKKTLLSRCVKPQWSASTGGTVRRTTFK